MIISISSNLMFGVATQDRLRFVTMRVIGLETHIAIMRVIQTKTHRRIVLTENRLGRNLAVRAVTVRVILAGISLVAQSLAVLIGVVGLFGCVNRLESGRGLASGCCGLVSRGRINVVAAHHGLGFVTVRVVRLEANGTVMTVVQTEAHGRLVLVKLEVVDLAVRAVVVRVTPAGVSLLA